MTERHSRAEEDVHQLKTTDPTSSAWHAITPGGRSWSAPEPGLYGLGERDRCADQLEIDFGAISSQVFAVMNVAKLLVPLGLLELYFWAQRRAGSIGRIVVASVLVTATAVMGLGIYAVTTLRWLPRMLG